MLHSFIYQIINFRTYQTKQLHMSEYQFSYLPDYAASYVTISIFVPTRLRSFICQNNNFRTYQTTQLHMPEYRFFYVPDCTASRARL